MARIQFTAVVSDIRGKLAGTVFSKNAYGAFTRTKVSPVNRRSVDQVTARSRLSYLSSNWRGLTQAQRNGWNERTESFATTGQFGQQKKLSGQALYVGLNASLAAIGQAYIDDAPMPEPLPDVYALSAVADASAGTVVVTFNDVLQTGYTVLLFGTPQLSAGITNAQGKFRQLLSGPLASATINIGAQYVAKFGAMSVGQKIFIEARIVNNDTGEQSAPSVVSTVVVA